MDYPSYSFEELISSESFQKYVLNPGEEEIKFWSEYLSRYPEQKESIQEAKNWILALGSRVDKAEVEIEYQKFTRSLQTKAYAKTKVRPFQRTRLVLGAAAMISLMLLGVWAVQKYSKAEFKSIQTQFGEMQSFRLSDGSEVHLNANSQVHFAKSWEGEELRELWIEGEGFFDIAHDPSKAFVVHTPQGDIKVLGTSFNVFQRNKELDVTLIEGKVRLNLADKKTINMQAGEQVKVAGGNISKERVDTEPITAWKFDKMIFKEASIANIINRLKVEFDWDIQVKRPEILDKKISAKIPKNDPGILMEALGELYELEVKQLGKKKYLIR
ncbi:MAG: FecR domain-containing protein [Bacteroidota bacterium]